MQGWARQGAGVGAPKADQIGIDAGKRRHIGWFTGVFTRPPYRSIP